MSYLTIDHHTIEGAIRIAADAGYDALGLRLAPAFPGGKFHDLPDRAALTRAREALQASGLHVFDIEMVRLNAGFRADKVCGLLDDAAALGAGRLLVVVDDPDAGRAAQSYAELRQEASARGIDAALEYMPQSALHALPDAVRLIATAGGGRVILDALHHDRTGHRADAFGTLDPRVISYFQICDAGPLTDGSVSGLHQVARHTRLLPGDGIIDLAGMIRTLPEGIPVSVEVPNDAGIARYGPVGWARLARERAERFFVAVAPSVIRPDA